MKLHIKIISALTGFTTSQITQAKQCGHAGGALRLGSYTLEDVVRWAPSFRSWKSSRA